MPRALAYFTMWYGFNRIKMKRMFSVANSLNTRVLKLMQHLGFRQVYRAPDCHEHGGDILLYEILLSDVLPRRYYSHGQENSTSIA